MLIQAAFCVLDFMLPAYIRNFAKLSAPQRFSRHNLMVSMQIWPVLYIILSYVISFHLIWKKFHTQKFSDCKFHEIDSTAVICYLQL